MASQLRTNNIQLLKDKRTLQTYTQISSRLKHLAMLFGMIEHNSKEAKLLKKLFILFKKNYEEVTVSIVNKDYDRLVKYIKSYKEIKLLRNKLVNEVSNHLIIQSTLTLSMAASSLKDLAYETLI